MGSIYKITNNINGKIYAVIKFQGDKKISVDGSVGPQTWKKILGIA